MPATLPIAEYGASAVWDGTHTYIFGGTDAGGSYLDSIVRYNPVTDTVTTMTATLPTSRKNMSAVWDGANAYIFGGFDGSYLDGIVRYNPATDTVTTMAATLPTIRGATSAVWDGANAYIFGGYPNSASGYSDEIVRYNPATDMVTTMTATLPGVRGVTSAVWDGANAYIFGGYNGGGSGGDVDEIVRYNPATDTVTTMPATLPTGRHFTSVVWDGANAYIFGGQDSGGGLFDEIVRYNPATDAVTTMPGTLPTARSGTSAVWNGINSYVFGGIDSSSRLDEIVKYDSTLTSDIPTGVTSCANYNSKYGPSPYPGQDLGIVIEFDPAGPAGDVAFCFGTVTGYPCQPGQPGVLFNNGLTCVPPLPSVVPCSTSPGPGWAVGVNGLCIGLPWIIVGGVPGCSATVNVRIYWGTTPGFAPGSTLDICL